MNSRFLPLLLYITRCKFECQVVSTASLVSCTPWSYPQVPGYPACNPWAGADFAHLMDAVNISQACSCLPDCEQILYRVQHTMAPIE